MLRRSFWSALAISAALACTLAGGTFGKVVSIGGQSSDLALDESRGVLYVANFTANRIEVVSLATYRSDLHQCRAAAKFDWPFPRTAGIWSSLISATSRRRPRRTIRLTVIDLTNNGQQTFALVIRRSVSLLESTAAHWS